MAKAKRTNPKPKQPKAGSAFEADAGGETLTQEHVNADNTIVDVPVPRPYGQPVATVLVTYKDKSRDQASRRVNKTDFDPEVHVEVGAGKGKQ